MTPRDTAVHSLAYAKLGFRIRMDSAGIVRWQGPCSYPDIWNNATYSEFYYDPKDDRFVYSYWESLKEQGNPCGERPNSCIWSWDTSEQFLRHSAYKIFKGDEFND